MIGKVLVAVDGSACADRALDLALDIAEKFSASVVVLNVLQIPVYGDQADPLAVSPSMSGIIRDIRKTHQNLLAKAVQRAMGVKPSVKVSSELREGSPPAQIVDVAVKGGFDLLVLGHSGEGRLQELLMGGTSERVAHLARCPVLIVK